MSDETPAAPFTFRPAPLKAAAAPTKTARKTTLEKVEDMPAPKRQRKTEPAPEAPVKRRKPRALKVDPLVVFEAAAGLELNDVPAIAKIMQEIQKFPAKSRARIVTALGKVFK